MDLPQTAPPQKDSDLDPGPGASSQIQCKVCGEELAASEAVGCSRCLAPYHTDCYHYNGKCAIFGCGNTSIQPFEKLALSAVKKDLTITENTRAPIRIDPFLEGLKRKFVTRSRDLPMTLGAGLLGSVLTMIGFATFVDGQMHETLVLGLLFCGVGPGLLAPFLAPFQQRKAQLATAMSGFVFFFFYFLRLNGNRFFWSTLTVAAGIFFATSLSEAIFGKYTPTGHALGRLASPIRHLTSWAFFYYAILAGAMFFGESLGVQAFQEIKVLSVLALVAAVPALEMGKEDHRPKLEQSPSRPAELTQFSEASEGS